MAADMAGNRQRSAGCPDLTQSLFFCTAQVGYCIPDAAYAKKAQSSTWNCVILWRRVTKTCTGPSVSNDQTCSDNIDDRG
jgi:hypothetical protein